MKTAEAIFKRLLNVSTVGVSLWLGFIALIAAIGGVSDWSVYVIKNVAPAVGAYICIAVASYVLFGRFALWHRSPQKQPIQQPEPMRAKGPHGSP